jgi:hypothetical protein|tara:strand:- start:517 stop:774 length:258 start_codon:yes stop_codon:yes gene_type:complete
MNITYNNTTYSIPKPFNECYFGSNPVKEMTITNPYSNDSVKLPAFAVAIYDTIKGAEHTEEYDIVQKGLTWFQKNFSSEYYTLLD